MPVLPGGLEAPEPYDVRHFPNRWPALPAGCHEVILHSPVHTASFPVLGEEQAARVVGLWSARTAALGSRDDVKYVFVFENRGRMIGATIDHPHSQIMAFTMIPPGVEAELSAGKCDLCQGVEDDLVVIRRSSWQAAVPWAPSWPYEMLLSPRSHVPDLPAAARSCGPGWARCWWRRSPGWNGCWGGIRPTCSGSTSGRRTGATGPPHTSTCI